jgi:hypothetical protein
MAATIVSSAAAVPVAIAAHLSSRRRLSLA